ncbi:MAG TPA: HAD family hydrolase [Actinomycetota bacterium]|nr:HAD family hydrolase [Actinomycetota bacterium]
MFDYGHTLVNFQRVETALVAAYGEIRERLESLVEHDLPQAEELAHQITGAMDVIVHRSYSEGRLQELDIVEMLVDAFAGIGVTLGPELAQELAVLDHRAFSESITVPESTIGVLEALAARGLTMGLVSNITLLPDLLRADLEAFGLARFLSVAGFSSEVGWRKPDRRIFAHVLERLGAAPEEAVFVGDRLRDDVGGARAAGMRSVLTRQFRDELEGPERAEALASPGELARLQPDHVIMALDELPDLLDSISSY